MPSDLPEVSDLAAFLGFLRSEEWLAVLGKQPLASGRQRVESTMEWEELSSSSPLVVILPPWGHLAMSGDVFGVTVGAGDATGTWWVEARDAVKHLTRHRAVPATKNYECHLQSTLAQSHSKPIHSSRMNRKEIKLAQSWDLALSTPVPGY